MSVAKGDLQIGSEDEKKRAEDTRKESEESLKDLLLALRAALQDEIKDVRLSSRLTESPACLVGDAGDLSPQMQELLRRAGQEVPKVKRVLELNPTHPIVTTLRQVLALDAKDPRLALYAELLHGQALLVEGGTLPDPGGVQPPAHRADAAGRPAASIEDSRASTLQRSPVMTLTPGRLLTTLRRTRPVRTASPWAWTLLDAIRVRWDLRNGPDEFDRTYGVRTRVVATLGEFPRTFFRGGVEHEPTPVERFRAVLDGLDPSLSDTVFIDYGSGAGRAVLLAATYPFKEVVGIELSPSLHQRAQANLRVFPAHARRARAVRLVCGDATAFALPSDPAVLYFYNPFREGVMRRVRAAIEASLTRAPRRVTIVLAFCYKGTREVIERSPFFGSVSVDRGITVLRSLTPSEIVRRAPDRSTA